MVHSTGQSCSRERLVFWSITAFRSSLTGYLLEIFVPSIKSKNGFLLRPLTNFFGAERARSAFQCVTIKQTPSTDKGVFRMKIIQKVTLKQVLTVRSKEKLLQYYSEQRQKLQKESDQLHFEQKKMERRNKFNQESVNNYFAKEIEMRYEKVKLIEFQVEQLDILPLGSEIKEQELDAILDVAVGDTWDDSMFTKTILVKDNIIVEIR